MKKIIFTLTLFISTIGITNAQFDIANFYGGGDIGFSRPVGEISEFLAGGLTFSGSIGYSIDEKISVGIEYSSTLAAGIDTSGNSGFLGLNVYGLEQYLATGQYRFLEGKFTPFVGLGLGVARTQEPSFVDANGMEVQSSRIGFGGKAEVGIALGGLMLKYAFALNGRTPEDTFFNINTSDLAVNYHRFTGGYIYNF